MVRFGSSIQNMPESLMIGCITTEDKIEYHFKTFGAITVVFVEAKLKIGSAEERRNVIAQVKAECDGKASPVLGVDFSTCCQIHSLRLEQHVIRYQHTDLRHPLRWKQLPVLHL